MSLQDAKEAMMESYGKQETLHHTKKLNKVDA